MVSLSFVNEFGSTPLCAVLCASVAPQITVCHALKDGCARSVNQKCTNGRRGAAN